MDDTKTDKANKNEKNEKTEQSAGAAQKPEAAALIVEQAIKAVKAAARKNITVRVPRMEAGKPLREADADGKDLGRFDVTEVPLAPEHVVSFYADQTGVTVITVDGRRLRTSELAAA